MTECLAPNCYRRASKDAAFCGLHERRAVYAGPYGSGEAPPREYVTSTALSARRVGRLSTIEQRALRRTKGAHRRRCSVCKKSRSLHRVWADQAKTICGFRVGRSV